MDAKKMVREAQRALVRSVSRRSCGDVGGIKLLPSQAHGSEPVRNKNVPILTKDGKVDLDAYLDME